MKAFSPVARHCSRRANRQTHHIPHCQRSHHARLQPFSSFSRSSNSASQSALSAASATSSSSPSSAYSVSSASSASSSSVHASQPAVGSRLLHTAPLLSSIEPLPSIPTSKHSIVGEALSAALDLSAVHIGQVIEVPYETTTSDSHQTLWQSTFHIHDRLYTSSPFAQRLDLASHPLPFSQVLFSAISMTHVDESREVLDLAYDNAVYVRPAFAGDTFRQTFTIKHLRNTSDGKNTILTVLCELYNQRQQLLFSVDKVMLYPQQTHPYKLSPAAKSPPPPPRSHLLAHLMYHADALPSHNTNLAIVRPHQLILHTVARPIGVNSNMALSTLFRWTHPSIYNTAKYSDTELTVPGGLVLAAVIGASSRGFFECLSETIDSCSLINKVAPTDLIGAISYVQHVKEVKEGIEELYVTTVGVKGIDVRVQLEGVRVPVELFTERMRPHVLERFLNIECPQLQEHVVMQIHRRIVRQSPYAQQRSIPLL